jgi:cation diffusion facilitator family transporter
MSQAGKDFNSHVFLGESHERSERRTWLVIALCSVMMIAEIAGGFFFGSIALVADGLHMSTHAGALLLASLAYTLARKYAHDPRFTFGTGKLGDLAGYTSAIILAMMAILIAYESVSRLFDPVPIHFAEALPIACLGLAVNIASAWLLGGGRDHNHSHAPYPEAHHHDASKDGVPPHAAVFEEDEHGHISARRDNNMQAAIMHVLADALVSVLVIAGLLLAKSFGWLWMDPLAGIVGACVTASWSYGLIRDTGAILIDMNPDRRMAENIRNVIESDGDHLTDLHLWRLGPGHLGAIIAVRTREPREPEHYRARLARFRPLSHVTIEVERSAA